MPIAFRCQQCGESFNAADALAGKKIKCRKCSAVVSVPRSPSAAQPVAATPAEPAPDLLGMSLAPLATPANSPLLAVGPGYSPQARLPSKRPPAPQRGPGVIQSIMMIGGTVLLVVLSAGVHAGAARFLPQRVASPKTGAEAIRGLPKGPLTSPGVGIPPSAKPRDDEDRDE